MYSQPKITPEDLEKKLSNEESIIPTPKTVSTFAQKIRNAWSSFLSELATIFSFSGWGAAAGISSSSSGPAKTVEPTRTTAKAATPSEAPEPSEILELTSKLQRKQADILKDLRMDGTRNSRADYLRATEESRKEQHDGLFIKIGEKTFLFSELVDKDWKLKDTNITKNLSDEWKALIPTLCFQDFEGTVDGRVRLLHSWKKQQYKRYCDGKSWPNYAAVCITLRLNWFEKLGLNLFGKFPKATFEVTYRCSYLPVKTLTPEEQGKFLAENRLTVKAEYDITFDGKKLLKDKTPFDKRSLHVKDLEIHSASIQHHPYSHKEQISKLTQSSPVPVDEAAKAAS